jgi:hypothetical protein
MLNTGEMYNEQAITQNLFNNRRKSLEKTKKKLDAAQKQQVAATAAVSTSDPRELNLVSSLWEKDIAPLSDQSYEVQAAALLLVAEKLNLAACWRVSSAQIEAARKLVQEHTPGY